MNVSIAAGCPSPPGSPPHRTPTLLGFDAEEILERVFTVLGELGCLPPPPVAGVGA